MESSTHGTQCSKNATKMFIFFLDYINLMSVVKCQFTINVFQLMSVKMYVLNNRYKNGLHTLKT